MSLLTHRTQANALHSMNFPLLTGVDSSLIISSSDAYTLFTGPYSPLAINFPSLRNATEIYIDTNISRFVISLAYWKPTKFFTSIYMPLLSLYQNNAADDNGQISGASLYIHANNQPVNISFPSLSFAQGISLSGAVERCVIPKRPHIFETCWFDTSFSVPSLPSLDGDFVFDSGLPVALNLSTFQVVNGFINLKGNLSAYVLSIMH